MVTLTDGTGRGWTLTSSRYEEILRLYREGRQMRARLDRWVATIRIRIVFCFAVATLYGAALFTVFWMLGGLGLLAYLPLAIWARNRLSDLVDAFADEPIHLGPLDEQDLACWLSPHWLKEISR